MKLARQGMWGAVLCLVWSGCSHTPPSTIMGKWRWAATWHAQTGLISARKKKGELIHHYKPDSTYDIYEDGKLSVQNQAFSIRRAKHPDGSGKPVDFLIRPDEEIMQPNQLVWIKGKSNDTLVFMLLDEERGYKPYVYSVYARVTE